ncbi:substrate-binding domain-containing protein [Ralstonia pickettii]|uniref:Substrate-binding domain-containing protein n=2 Tax=Pseudomonadota TaxID=1224 RepID=A0A7X2HPB8_RALPI|nr:LacI family DNA-binding transcriptional regulator [Ralstonia pickettii]MRT00196.1 substrate-binding domain-containing protein [Ralstonia pickettii]NWK46639.1 LacI family DNA-binding transcriptional regulator [Ralstonia pickettii]OCS48632.1 LacI family transcriptional regulator [Ralstonia pickettii]
MKKSSPTIRDVAAAAEVSVATVSKYMNSTQRFSAPVEAKLKAAIEQLGYRSNPLARSMITGKTRTIGLAILDIRNPHFTNIVKGANRIALQNDYTLLLVDTEESQERERQLIEALAQRVDGMIVSSRMPEEAIQWMIDLNKPVVLFGRTRDLPIPSVGTDSHLAAYMLARHLLNEGHRHVAYLGFGQSRWNAERIRGVTECFQEAGLTIDVHDAHAPSAQAGEHACSAIMLAPKRPEAVICYNDLIALGFMKEARALGFKLPDDVSVVGFDNVPYGEYASPALTTMDLQSERMGEVAMQKLLDVLAGHDGNGEYSLLEPRLIVRESTRRREVEKEAVRLPTSKPRRKA